MRKNEQWEKLIRGLECCIKSIQECQCEDGCPYVDKCWSKNDDDPMYVDLMRDAISLLKAQEPRVMTLDEVKNLPAETDVWIQHAGNFADDVIRAATVFEVTNASISFLFGGSLYYMKYGEKPYGWICWTSRPTNEQRKAVKWDD